MFFLTIQVSFEFWPTISLATGSCASVSDLICLRSLYVFICCLVLSPSHTYVYAHMYVYSYIQHIHTTLSIHSHLPHDL